MAYYFGTYGTRLHGARVPTVDKRHNQFGSSFVLHDPTREELSRARMKFSPRVLTAEQRMTVETELPLLCVRREWTYRMCSAGSDHIHLLCDVIPEVHGEKVRRLVKRWLGQVLSKRWPLPQHATWWAEEGSNKAIDNEQYLNNCYSYILRQRSTPFTAGAEDGPAL